MSLNGFVAFARAFLQAFFIQHLDFAAGVFYEARALERVGDHGHACASYPEHLRQIFLRERERVAPGQIPGPQQPAAQPGLHVVGCKARSRLLCLRVDRLLVTDQQRK